MVKKTFSTGQVSRAFVWLCALCVVFAVAAGNARAAAPAAFGSKTPVLLTIDVEGARDIEALASIDLQVPATYFIVGRFLREYPDYARALSLGNTIGAHSYNHPDLTTLSAEELDDELARDINAHLNVLGRAPAWFRAPFLAIDDTVEEALARNGYTYDSSRPERWAGADELIELPISTADSFTLASDYDLFVRMELSGDAVLAWLKKQFDDRHRTGRPLVILLHPYIVAPHAAVLKEFIDYVQSSGGVFVTADQYAAAAEQTNADRQAIWLTLAHGEIDEQQAADILSRSGFTDVFVMARTPEGEVYFGQDDDRFGPMVAALKAKGLRVHAWLPVLKNDALVAAHPDWAMTGYAGEAIEHWWSPTQPEARQRFLSVVRQIETTYPVDGIHLDYVRYPMMNADLGEPVIARFLADRGIAGPLSFDEIMRDHFVVWSDWRAEAIANLVRDVREVLSPETILSAALMAEAATDFRAHETYGQEYALLAEHLDIVVPMAYANLKGKDPSWIDQVRRQTRFRVGRTAVWLGIEGYQEPGHRQLGRSDFAAALARARIGSEGISIYAYPFLFGVEETPWDMPEGSEALLLQ